MYARSKKCVGVDPLFIPAYPSMLNPFLGLPPGSLHTPSKPLYVKLSPFLAASPPQALLVQPPKHSTSETPVCQSTPFVCSTTSWRAGEGDFVLHLTKKNDEKWVLLGCVTCVFPWPASQMSLHTQLVAQRTGQTVRSQRNQYKCPTAQFSL